MSVAPTYHNPSPLGPTVKVFREHKDWDGREAWWQMRASLLEELYVTTYDLVLDDHGYPIEGLSQIEFIREQHPGCVLVYA